MLETVEEKIETVEMLVITKLMMHLSKAMCSGTSPEICGVECDISNIYTST